MSILVLDHHGIGDVILSLPLLDSLRRGFPDEPIDVIVKSPVEGELVATAGARRCITFHREHMGAMQWARFFACIVGRYRLMVATVNTNTRLAGWLGRAIAAQTTIGCAPEDGPFTINVASRNLHKVDDNLEIARRLGITPAGRAPVLMLPAGKQPKPASSARPLVAVHTGTGVLVGTRRFDTSIARFKEVPASFWIELITKVEASRGPVRWLFVGSGHERNVVDAVSSRLPRTIDVQDETGHLPILETARLIASANVFVGGDSGLAHVAAAVGTPAVALFGPTDPSLTGPVGAAVHALRSGACPLAPCYPTQIFDCRWPVADPLLGMPWQARRCMHGFDPTEVARKMVSYLGSGTAATGRG